MNFITPILCNIALVFTLNAFADGSVNAVHLGESTNTQQVIELLTPTKPKTRGLQLHSASEPSAAPTPRAISLEVFFDFDSYELKQTAKNQLMPIGEALQSEELASLSFTFEGHTDALGDENYNLKLSKKRADSVKNFLIEQFNVAESRINAIGKGESELQDPSDPASASNRRVTIITQ